MNSAAFALSDTQPSCAIRVRAWSTAKSGVLIRRFTTTMRINAPAQLVQGTRFLVEVPIINTGCHLDYKEGDSFADCPCLVLSAAEWRVEKDVKAIGPDTQANDHPLAT